MMKYIVYLIISFLVMSSCTSTLENKDFKKTTFDEDSILKKAKFGKELMEAFVPFVSPAVNSNGKINLSYELQIANTYHLPMTITKVEVYNVQDKTTPLRTFDSVYLKENLDRPGLRDKKQFQLFKGSQFGVLNLWLSLKGGEIPKQLYHKIFFDIQTKSGEMVALNVEKALIDFPNPTSLTLQLPFKTGNWFYYTLGHKNTRELTEGKPSYAQRYAIDWVYIEEDGHFLKGERNINENFFSYGKELLAVADGIIVDIQDSIPENNGDVIDRTTRLNRYNSSGNHVVLDIGNNINVVYAHLIPKQLKVKVGDKVKAGEVLGFLGNSGNSTGPHLHIHLETKNKIALGGEGLPFHFEKYTEVSRFDDSIDLDSLFSGTSLPMNNLNIIRENNVPIGIGVVRF